MNRQEEGVKLPKFIVELNEYTLFCGFYIRKADHPMGRDWYRPIFLKLLADPAWRGRIQHVIDAWGLHWELRFEEDVGSAGYRNKGVFKYVTADKGSCSVSNWEVSRFTWPDFHVHLAKLPKRQWCNLYLAQYIEKPEAIQLGVKVSVPIGRLFNDLAPLFWQLLSDFKHRL